MDAKARIAEAAGAVDSGSVGVAEEPTKRREVKTWLEEWAGHFGSCQERAEGVRQIEFREGVTGLRDYMSLCLAGVSTFPAAYMGNELSYRQQDGLNVISQLICEAAQKTLSVLDDERRQSVNCNKVLHAEIKSLQRKKADAEQQRAEAEKAADPDALKELRGVTRTLTACKYFFDSLQEGRFGKDIEALYDELLGRLLKAGISPQDAAAAITRSRENAAQGGSGSANAEQPEPVGETA